MRTACGLALLALLAGGVCADDNRYGYPTNHYGRRWAYDPYARPTVWIAMGPNLLLFSPPPPRIPRRDYTPAYRDGRCQRVGEFRTDWRTTCRSQHPYRTR